MIVCIFMYLCKEGCLCRWLRTDVKIFRFFAGRTALNGADGSGAPFYYARQPQHVHESRGTCHVMTLRVWGSPRCDFEYRYIKDEYKSQ